MSKTKDYFFGDSQEILNDDPDYLDWSQELDLQPDPQKDLIEQENENGDNRE